MTDPYAALDAEVAAAGGWDALRADRKRFTALMRKADRTLPRLSDERVGEILQGMADRLQDNAATR